MRTEHRISDGFVPGIGSPSFVDAVMDAFDRAKRPRTSFDAMRKMKAEGGLGDILGGSGGGSGSGGGAPSLRFGRGGDGNYRTSPHHTGTVRGGTESPHPSGTVRGGGQDAGPHVSLGKMGSKFDAKAPVIMDGLMKKYGLTREQAAGILGNLGEESGGFTAYHEGGKAPGSGGVGWAQWTGVRRVAFERWVAAHGLNPTSDEASWRYLTEGDPETAKAIAAVKRQSTVGGAMRAFHDSFEKSGDTDRKTGRILKPKNWNTRLHYADRAFSLQPGGAMVAAGAAAAPSTPSTDSRSPVYLGDSIAKGLMGAGRGTGDATVGLHPREILRRIQRLDPATLKGRDVVLSGGASNNVRDAGMLGDEIDALKAKGVDPSRIRVVGVGDRADYRRAGVNDTLARIAKDRGASFTGPIRPGRDHVHPRDYRETLRQVLGAADAGPGAVAQPTTPTAAEMGALDKVLNGYGRAQPNAEARRYMHWQRIAAGYRGRGNEPVGTLPYTSNDRWVDDVLGDDKETAEERHRKFAGKKIRMGVASDLLPEHDPDMGKRVDESRKTVLDWSIAYGNDVIKHRPEREAQRWAEQRAQLNETFRKGVVQSQQIEKETYEMIELGKLVERAQKAKEEREKLLGSGPAARDAEKAVLPQKPPAGASAAPPQAAPAHVDMKVSGLDELREAHHHVDGIHRKVAGLGNVSIRSRVQHHDERMAGGPSRFSPYRSHEPAQAGRILV